MRKKLSPRVLSLIGLLAINVFLIAFLFAGGAEKNAPTDHSQWRTADYPEISVIQGSNWDFQKLVQFFKTLAEDKGGEYAYHALATAANKGYLTANVDTHLLGHEVGNVLYKQQGIQGIKSCTDDLRNACSHSIVVGYLLDNGEEKLPVAVAVCKDAPGGSGAYTMCVHGLGHGVLGYVEYDMRRAVELCKKTGTAAYNNQEVGQCIGGVTMEMMSGVHDKEDWEAQTPNYFKDNDPLAPCNMGFIPESALSFCYVYLTPHLLEAAGAEMSFPDPKFYPKAMSFCDKLPKGDRARETCFSSFGKEFVVLANARNVQSVENMDNDKLRTIYNWCALAPEEGISPCIHSALQSLYWGGENDPDVAIRFCGVIPDQAKKDKCMDDLFKAVSYYMKHDSAYRQAFCEKIPSQYQESCRVKAI